MPKYRVDLRTSAGCTVLVEADDPEAAIEEALIQAPSEVCAQCSGWGESYTLELGEWDTSGDDDLCVEELS